MTRAEKVTREIRKYDRLLYCEKFNRDDGTGQVPLVIYRKLFRYETMEVDGNIIHYKVPSPHYVFALTDTWSVNGTPVEWGILPIMARLRAMDLWKEETEVDRMKEHSEKVDLAKEKDMRNNIESFMYEFRSQFAKATDGINTSSLEKRKDRRFKDDLKIKEN